MQTQNTIKVDFKTSDFLDKDFSIYKNVTTIPNNISPNDIFK